MPWWAWLLIGLTAGAAAVVFTILWVFTKGFSDFGMGN